MNDLDQAWSFHQAEIIGCARCPRLVAWREEVARVRRRAYQDQAYWGRPVPGFGDHKARVLVVGLAPGAHGSNRTGRMFTGDSSGDFLYPALFEAGFASQATAASREDGLQLKDLFITAVCRCVPPQNRPTSQEMANCRSYLEQELTLLPRLEGIVALGKIAYDVVMRLYREQGYGVPKMVFQHGGSCSLGDGLPWLMASYHPSRQNTQTGRLTVEMFADIWRQVNNRLGREVG